MGKKLGLVKCRICGEHIDREKQDDWIMPSKNYFYLYKKTENNCSVRL